MFRTQNAVTAFDRGEPRVEGSRGRPGQGFNAATAMTPWRTCPGQPRRRARGAGFNAATAVEPWSTPLVRGQRRAAQRASMRPRPLSRGERKHRDGWKCRRAGFNAATAMTPWRTMSAARGATPGPGSFNAATAMMPWRSQRVASVLHQIPNPAFSKKRRTDATQPLSASFWGCGR
jgi:hypothetical protein